MTPVPSELFARFTYCPELSYEALHSREEALRRQLETLLVPLQAAYLNFDPRGDALLVRGQFPAYSEDSAHTLCEALAPFSDQFLEGKLLFVRQDLHLLSLYVLAGGLWQEALFGLPFAGPIEARLAQGAKAAPVVIRRKNVLSV